MKNSHENSLCEFSSPGGELQVLSIHLNPAVEIMSWTKIFTPPPGVKFNFRAEVLVLNRP